MVEEEDVDAGLEEVHEGVAAANMGEFVGQDGRIGRPMALRQATAERGGS